jgi:hypothetical protein
LKLMISLPNLQSSNQCNSSANPCRSITNTNLPNHKSILKSWKLCKLQRC